MTIPILFDYWRSSASYRVRIALNLKGVRFQSVSIDLAAGAQAEEAYRARNPQGLVPMLEVGDLRLAQSLAIIAWLDATYPDPPLLPADPAQAAHVQAMALTIAETLAAKNSEFPNINCLVDTTELLIVDYKDLEWAAKEGDVLFYKLGVRKIAFIVPETRFEKFYLETYKYHATRHPENHVQREQFKTEEEALVWLKEPLQEIS